MSTRVTRLYGDLLNKSEAVPFPPPTTPKSAWTHAHDKLPMSTSLGHSDSNDPERNAPVSAVVSRPGAARRIISEEEHAPGWRSWLDRENFAFFIFGLLVPLPVMTIMSASRLMFPGIAGIAGIAFAIPGAIASFVLPMLGPYVPYNITILINVLLSLFALLICTVGSGLAGPLVGAAIGGVTSSLGQYLYLAVAASFDQRVVITFSIGTKVIFVLRECIYLALMAVFHQDWRWTLRVTMLLPVAQVAVWSFMLSQELLEHADRTRQLIVKADARHDSAINLPQYRDPTASSVSSKPFGPTRSKLRFLWRTIIPQYTLPLTVSVMGAMIATTGLASSYLTLNTFQLAPKGDLNYQLNWIASGFGEITFSMISLFKALPWLWAWAFLQTVVVGTSIAQLFSPLITYFPVWLLFAFLIGGFEGAASTNTNYKIAEDFRKNGEPEEVRAFAMSYAACGNFMGDVLGGAIAVVLQRYSETHLKVSAGA